MIGNHLIHITCWLFFHRRNSVKRKCVCKVFPFFARAASSWCFLICLLFCVFEKLVSHSLFKVNISSNFIFEKSIEYDIDSHTVIDQLYLYDHIKCMFSCICVWNVYSSPVVSVDYTSHLYKYIDIYIMCMNVYCLLYIIVCMVIAEKLKY